MEARSGSVILDAFFSMFRKKSPSPQPPPPAHVTAMLQGAGVYSFREGIQTLTDALHKRIAPSCSIRIKARVASLAPQKDGLVKVLLEGGEEIEAHHVFSSVDSQTLSKLISKGIIFPPSLKTSQRMSSRDRSRERPALCLDRRKPLSPIAKRLSTRPQSTMRAAGSLPRSRTHHWPS